jgi:hypothetical protein
MKEAGMRRKGWVVVAIGAVAGLAATQGSRAGGHSGDDDRHRRGCSVATLRGAYGIQIQGTRPALPPAPAGTVESVIGVILRHYDGDGQFTQVNNEKGSVGGNGPVDREGSGTYQVNEDCTGSHELHIPGVANPVTDRFVIVDRGREVRHFVVSPASVMVTGVSQKIDAR